MRKEMYVTGKTLELGEGLHVRDSRIAAGTREAAGPSASRGISEIIMRWNNGYGFEQPDGGKSGEWKGRPPEICADNTDEKRGGIYRKDPEIHDRADRPAAEVDGYQ